MKVVVPGLPPVDLGITETTPTVGITDYSRRVTDDFGVTTVVKRGFARRLSLRFALPFEEVDALQSRLASLRATKATWIADDRFRALSVTGIYKDFSIDVASQPCSFCTLNVDGFAETLDVPDDGSDPAVDGASTFRLLQPVAVTDAVLRASSVPENDAPAWSAGATYAKGTQVVADHYVYESLTDGNIGNPPPSVEWLDVSPTNRFAMFDQALGSATMAVDAITVTLASAGATAVAVLDVIGAVVRVQGARYDAQRPVDGTMTFDGLPEGDITVTVTGSGTVAIGTLLFGRIVALGVTETSPTAEIADYSRKETDEFGDVTVVERAWAKRMAARTLFRADALDPVFERIATVRALPSLWIADDGTDALSVYGFCKDFSIEVGETTAKLSLQIEGLSKAAKLTPIGGGGSVAWPDITDPDGTKPKDDADKTSENTSKDTKAVGGRPAAGLLALIDEIDTVAIPAVNSAVAAANVRIDAARQAADQAAADANARIDAADRLIDEAARDFAAEVERAQGADEALSRRIDSIVADGGGYDDRDIRAIIATEQTVRADDDRALGRRVDTVSASVIQGDDAVRADVKVTTDALARSDEAFAQRVEVVEASLGTVDDRISAKATEITTAYTDGDRALGQRIDSLVADGSYDDTDLRAEISRVDTTAISRDAAVARSVERIESKSAAGNLVRKATFEDGQAGTWPVGAYESRIIRPADFGQPAPPYGDYVYLMRGLRDVLEGDIWIKGAWGGRKLRITGYASSQFSSADSAVGVFGRNPAGQISFLAIPAAPQGVAGYTRFDGVVTLPADTVEVIPWLQNNTAPGTESAEVRLHSLSITDATQAQENAATIETRYNTLVESDRVLAERSSALEAASATVDARIAAKATELTRAFTDGDTALATRATTLEAAASAVSTSIVFNDNFNFWVDAQPLPSRWVVWLSGGNFRTARLAPGRGGGQYCVQTLNDVADVESGFVQTIYTAGAGKWVIEVTAGFDGSGARGAGVTLHGVWNIDFCSDPDVNGVVGDRPGETRSWTKMVDLDGRDQINVHAMHGWSGFGRGMAAKYMVWHRLAVRPATDGEIKAGKADATLNGPGGVLARITANENTIADLPNRYAAASRTATLEAQLRGEAASGLGDTINAVNGRIDTSNSQLTARIEERATAIADAKAGAVAQTVETLRSDYNGTAATVTQQAGTIADVNYRTRAYMRSEVVAGGNRAQINIYADSNNGAGVEIVGDVLISGNLLVSGTVITDKIANQAVTSNVAVTAQGSTASNGQTKTVASATLVASGSGYTRIDVQYDMRVSGQGTTGTAYASIKRVQNGAEANVGRSVAVQPQSGTGEPASFWFVDQPASGQVSYELVLTTDSGNRIFGLFNITIAVSEFKK